MLTMPGARPTVAGALQRLIIELSECADDGAAICLDTCDTIAALSAAYASLISAQHDRKASR